MTDQPARAYSERRSAASSEYTPTCSVVICTHDRPAELEACLAGVAAQSYPCSDVLVVDSAPSDHCAEEIARRWGARYLLERVPGLSRARNVGARACRTEFVAFIDDDAIPEPDWLAGLAPEFCDPLVMTVAGRRLPLKSETESERLCTWEDDGHTRLVVDCQTPFWFEMANFGGIGNGTNIAFRRRAFDFWPGFHESLGRGAVVEGGEEHYAFFSLIDLGYRAVHTPRAVVRHPFPETLAALRQRQTNHLAAAMGYVVLLLVEETRHRKAVLKYVLEALRGMPRVWRAHAGSGVCLVPPWRRPIARLRGPLRYLWSRLTEKAPSRRLSQSIATELPLAPAAEEIASCPKSVAR